MGGIVMAGDAVADLVAVLTARGIVLQAEGGRLRFRPKAAMTPDLAERVKLHKPELLALLAGGPEAEAPWPPAGKSHADKAWQRFVRMAIHWPDGRWYDPVEQTRFDRLIGPNSGDRKPKVHFEPLTPSAGTEHEESAAERAARWRAAWERDGYPPGVRPTGDSDGA